MEVLLTTEKLSLDAIYEAVRAPRFGGVSIFSGDVRDTEDGAGIEAIEYEAYESMARKELEGIAADVEKTLEARVAVHHRTGRVAVGESSVLVAAAAAHRAEAFQACREVIDRLKKTAPIWKISFVPAEAP